MACALGAVADEIPLESDPATALREQYAALNNDLAQSQIRPGLYLESQEGSRTSRGDIYAVVEFDFATIDRKLLAIEYAELAHCVRAGSQPEVGGSVGREAVALICALFESQVAGRPVWLAEVLSGEVDAYQREIDQHFGLV